MPWKDRKVPQRRCVACRQVRPKREMRRVVRTPTGQVVVDPSGKQSGRGAYVCPTSGCVSQALQRDLLERALGVTLEPEQRAHLASAVLEGIETLP
jgi:predicted RNA-binding protein YlxR (DUF448 family)